MKDLIKFESIKVNVPTHKSGQTGYEEIALTRYYKNLQQLAAPILMVHGVAQDGRSFYNGQGEGLAAFLVREGFDVYVADLRGRGKGWPRISSRSEFGLHHWITQDIPACVQALIKKRGDIPQIWIGHGWGGVALTAAYCRFGQQWPVKKIAYLGCRRKRSVSSWSCRLSTLAVPLSYLFGYLPTGRATSTLSNESKQLLREQEQWSRSDSWTDPVDDFDYGAASAKIAFPPSFYMASDKDGFSHPDDVRAFMKTLGKHDGRMLLLSKTNGNLRNYGHRAMLLHPDCEQDHFQDLIDWLNINQVVD